MPRTPRGLGKGALLAVLVHVLLILVLALGVSWKVREPEGVQAELWSAVPQTAAPPAAQHKPQPVAPAAPSVAAPAPPTVQPRRAEPVARPAPPVVDAQIAIEKAKREQAKREQAQQLAEEREALKRQRLKQETAKQEATKQEAVKQARESARLEKAQRDKVAADAVRQQAALRQQQQARAEQERQKQEQIEQARTEATLAAQRQANLKRMQGQAAATGADSSTGTAARDSGPSAGYAGRIKARIKPNIVFNDSVAGNPTATVEVRVAPDGTIVSRHLSKSSGVKAWDDAVLRAIDKTEVLPRDVDGRVPPQLQIDFKPND